MWASLLSWLRTGSSDVVLVAFHIADERIRRRTIRVLPLLHVTVAGAVAGAVEVVIRHGRIASLRLRLERRTPHCSSALLASLTTFFVEKLGNGSTPTLVAPVARAVTPSGVCKSHLPSPPLRVKGEPKLVCGRWLPIWSETRRFTYFYNFILLHICQWNNWGGIIEMY